MLHNPVRMFTIALTLALLSMINLNIGTCQQTKQFAAGPTSRSAIAQENPKNLRTNVIAQLPGKYDWEIAPVSIQSRNFLNEFKVNNGLHPDAPGCRKCPAGYKCDCGECIPNGDYCT